MYLGADSSVPVLLFSTLSPRKNFVWRTYFASLCRTGDGVMRNISMPSCLAPLGDELVVVVKATTVIVSIVVFGDVVILDVFFLFIIVVKIIFFVAFQKAVVVVDVEGVFVMTVNAMVVFE